MTIDPGFRAFVALAAAAVLSLWMSGAQAQSPGATDGMAAEAVSTDAAPDRLDLSKPTKVAASKKKTEVCKPRCRPGQVCVDGRCERTCTPRCRPPKVCDNGVCKLAQ